MNSISIIAYILSCIALILEIIGIWRTYRLKHEAPIKIGNSNIEGDLRAADMATLGGDYDGKPSASDIQSELNRIIDNYNLSVKILVDSTNRINSKSAEYFRLILYGFLLQLVSVVIFLLQECVAVNSKNGIPFSKLQ